MLTELKSKQLQDLISTSTKEELIWISGYISGLIQQGTETGNANGNGTTTSVKKISLLYGTETGNAKKVATNFAAVAKKKGINAKLTSLDQYKTADLAKEEYVFIVISTQGEGEPPVTAKKFYDYIHQNKLSLPNIKYSVLGLGDTSYPLFCKAGEDVDTQFNSFGAQRIVPLQKCDVDYESDAQQWFENVLKTLEQNAANVSNDISSAVVEKKISGKKYYNGTVSTNVNLNDRGSNKQTFHIEISTDEAVEYLPGDALAIVPQNRQAIVEKIITLTGIDPSLTIETSKVTATVEELLSKHLNICYLLSSTIKKYAELIQQDIPNVRMDLVDLLRIYPVKDSAQFIEVIKTLTTVAPRLYSISSSPNAHENEIHLTVSKHSFKTNDKEEFGLCSEFLSDLPEGTAVQFYIHKNRSFRLPEENKDIIMIGPGTGIAPFRSFIAERDATGASGQNWLFFGEQHFTSDFLYQTELQNYAQTGVLHKIDLAFSRDTKDKIYVQHRMKEKAKEIYEWLEKGAFIYVCGAKDPMSKDVENTLIQIIQEQGNKSEVEAISYLEQLKEESRYAKDVY